MSGLVYGSVCSGIEAATVAWRPLGWRPAFFSEIEAFPRAVLKHHWPAVPLHGDFTTIREGDYEPIDLLVGGTPCQDFSVAGLRAGLDGERGRLTLEFFALARRLRPRWLVWENVPGVLSMDEGRVFGLILGLLGQCGYGFAYRVLDAQYFGVPQRRRRVFVVGYLGDWRRAAAVLFERESLSGHPPPRREAGEGVAGALSASLGGSSGGPRGADDNSAQANHLISFDWQVAGSGRTDIHDLPGRTRSITSNKTLAIAFGGNDTRGPVDIATAVNAHGGPHGRLDFESETFVCQDLADPITASFHKHHGATGGKDSIPRNHILAFQERGRDGGRNVEWQNDVAYALTAPGDGGRRHEKNITAGMHVRRLTPRECERLQGLPDDYTLIRFRGKSASDGPRYKALGNSMAVPCMRWVGERIAMVDEIAAQPQARPA